MAAQWQGMLEVEEDTGPLLRSVALRSELKALLNIHYDMNEIRELCSRLGLDCEQIAGDTKRSKIRELVDFCSRRDLLDRLVENERLVRPNIPWPN